MNHDQAFFDMGDEFMKAAFAIYAGIAGYQRFRYHQTSARPMEFNLFQSAESYLKSILWIDGVSISTLRKKPLGHDIANLSIEVRKTHHVSSDSMTAMSGLTNDYVMESRFIDAGNLERCRNPNLLDDSMYIFEIRDLALSMILKKYDTTVPPKTPPVGWKGGLGTPNPPAIYMPHLRGTVKL